MIDLESRCDEFCDDQQLLMMLRSDNESFDSTDILDHIENCQRCQQRLDKLAADESDLQKTVSILSSQQGTDNFGNVTAANSLGDSQSAWAESMARQLLAPPVHPELMGRIGRYDVERLIGSGGMGIVFKAHDTELNRPVAIKLLAPYLCGSESARNRFAREARAAAAVVDEHVVPIHNVESDGEPPFLVMKYIAGGSLQQRLDREGPLDVCEVLRIGMQTAKGLAAAHAQGLIHRDVKPSNVLLDEGVERALLTDFGLAHASDDANLTRSGFHPGTPHYMSPEQIRGETIDARSDLFGLGCVLYSLCTGHPPFCNESSYAVLRRITDDRPESVRKINSAIPEWLERVVMKLLAKSPDDRFSSASEVANVLEGCLAYVQQPATTPLPQQVVALAPKMIRRWPFTKWIASVAVALCVLLAGVVIVLELNKGTLRIETNSIRDVPVRITQDDELVDELTVTKEGATVRLRAGKYIVEIDGEPDNFEIVGENVTLKRGDDWLAQVMLIPKGASSATAPRDYAVTENSPPFRLTNLPKTTEIHAVGCCETHEEGQAVDVRVESTGRPMVVVLTAYRSIAWNLNIAADADVRAVIVAGYFSQNFAHYMPQDIPTHFLTYFPIWDDISREQRRQRNDECFYAYSPFEEQFGRMCDRVTQITSRDVVTFQSAYYGESFVIDGGEGRVTAHLAKWWSELRRRGSQIPAVSGELVKTQTHLDGLFSMDPLSASDILKVQKLLSEFERLLPVDSEAELKEVESETKQHAAIQQSGEGKKVVIDNESEDDNLHLFVDGIPIPMKFATPEALMQHFADCQFRNDVPGCIQCYSDTMVNWLASSYLMTARMMTEGFLESELNSELNEESRKNLEQVKQLLDRSLIPDPPAIASAGLLQATKLYAKLSDEESDSPLSPEEGLLIASSASLLKNPRQFVIEFGANSDDDDSDKEPRKRRTYQIKHVGDRTFAGESLDSMFELKQIDRRWWIHGVASAEYLEQASRAVGSDAEPVLSDRKTQLSMIGIWRVKRLSNEDGKPIKDDDMAVMFDEVTMTWMPNPNESTRCVYWMLPDNRMEYTAIDTVAGESVKHFKIQVLGPSEVKLIADGGSLFSEAQQATYLLRKLTKTDFYSPVAPGTFPFADY